MPLEKTHYYNNKCYNLVEGGEGGIMTDETKNKIFLLRSKGYIESTLYGAFKSLFKSYEKKEFCYKII